MTPQEILQALYAGKINLEEARKAFIMRASSKPPSDFSTDTLLSQRTDLASSVTPSERVTVVSSGAIAIVGMSGKYPDAKNLSAYWDNLLAGKNAVREIPLSRFDVSNYYDPTPGA